MAFWVGQKVVCVRGFEPTEFNEALPVVGSVYTIREIETFNDDAWLFLEEIVNEKNYYADFYGEARFYAGKFRPLVDRKTDISIFTEMLHKEPATC